MKVSIEGRILKAEALFCLRALLVQCRCTQDKTFLLLSSRCHSKMRLSKSVLYSYCNLRYIFRGIRCCTSYILVSKLGLSINSEFLCHRYLCIVYSARYLRDRSQFYPVDTS